jgi:hypothetical protein
MQDLFGNQLDQNGNFIPGEIPDDEYILHFNISGPKITASQNLLFGDTANQIYNGVRVTFNESMNPASFTADQFQLTSPTGVAVPINSIAPVAGSNNTRFDVQFEPQGQIGVWQVVIGPNIRDTFGNAMDQNGNFITGEIPDDQYTTTFTAHGPRVPTDSAFVPANYADNAVLNTIFPGITLSVLGNSTDSVLAVPTPPGSAGGARVFGSNPTTTSSYAPEFYNDPSSGGWWLRINFANPVSSVSIDAIGTDRYSMQAKGLLRIYNSAGVLLGSVSTPDLLAGGQLETLSLTQSSANIAYALASSDQVNQGVLLDNLRFTAGTRISLGPVSSVRVTFTKPIDVSSFTPAKIASFTGPDGDVAVDGVFVVPGTNNTSFDITFPSQVHAGTYTLVIGPDVHDLFGNAMDQDDDLVAGEIPDDQYTAVFQIGGFAITAATSGEQVGTVDHIRLTFNEPVDPSTFTPDQVTSFTGPNGSIDISRVAPVPFTNNMQFDVYFDPQSALGNYTYTVGTGVEDLYGNPLATPYSGNFIIQNQFVVDPDDYGNNEVLNRAFTGVTLSVLGNSTDSVVALQTPPGSAGGARVFGSSSSTSGSYAPEFYNDPSGGGWWLRIDFATAVSSVSIDAIGTSRYSRQARGLLRAYNSAGVLLGTVTGTNLLTGGQLETLSLRRASADIAYVLASSDQVNQGVLLDNLRFSYS